MNCVLKQISLNLKIPFKLPLYGVRFLRLIIYLSEYVNESFLFPQTKIQHLYQKNHAFLAGLHVPVTGKGKSQSSSSLIG